MATQSTKIGPEFFAGDESPEALRRRFIEAPLEAAQQSALSSSLEIGKLLSILPDAFLASQQRELERVKKSAKEKDPRIEILQASIEQACVFRTTAQRVQARAERALTAFAGKDSIFHGFVSDGELSPLKGLTVRLIGGTGARATERSTTTEEDGYFCIVLGPKSKGKNEESPLNLSQRILNLMSGRRGETIGSAADDSETGKGRVEILKDVVLHRDPVAISLDKGSVYREYVIRGTESALASGTGTEDFTWDRSDKASSPQRRSNRQTDKPSQSKTDEPYSSPES